MEREDLDVALWRMELESESESDESTEPALALSKITVVVRTAPNKDNAAESPFESTAGRDGLTPRKILIVGKNVRMQGRTGLTIQHLCDSCNEFVREKFRYTSMQFCEFCARDNIRMAEGEEPQPCIDVEVKADAKKDETKKTPKQLPKEADLPAWKSAASPSSISRDELSLESAVREEAMHIVSKFSPLIDVYLSEIEVLESKEHGHNTELDSSYAFLLSVNGFRGEQTSSMLKNMQRIRTELEHQITDRKAVVKRVRDEIDEIRAKMQKTNTFLTSAQVFLN